uniref:Uncharacterized protein n=1 Tax=Ciona savignyi TaxID=51511 RepID=H2ZJZ4_CIOSA
MDIEVTGLQQLPEDLSKVSRSVFWRADDQVISTELFKTTPDVFLATVVQKGGLSAALCYAIFRSYPEASVSNFRQFTNSQLIFTVEQEGRFTEDVMTGIATRNINRSLNDLSSLLFDKDFDVYKKCSLVIELYRPSSTEYVSFSPQYKKDKEDHSGTFSYGMATSNVS